MVRIMKRNNSFLKAAAFCLLLIGIGGIAGAVETGTSPVNAVVVFLIGCLAMAAYMKEESISCWKEKTYGKEKVMSGFEKEELQTRIKGMAPEEQAAAAKTLPDSILFEELCRRYTDLREKVDNINRVMEEENGRG